MLSDRLAEEPGHSAVGYSTILRAEVAGGPFSKVEHRRALPGATAKRFPVP